MRTAISLDDQLAKQVRRAAEALGLSVSAFIAKTLDDALKRRETSATGKLVADAQHAAVAVEHGCTMVSTDSDFSRFPGLRWRHPLRPGQ